MRRYVFSSCGSFKVNGYKSTGNNSDQNVVSTFANWGLVMTLILLGVNFFFQEWPYLTRDLHTRKAINISISFTPKRKQNNLA